MTGRRRIPVTPHDCKPVRDGMWHLDPVTGYKACRTCHQLSICLSHGHDWTWSPLAKRVLWCSFCQVTDGLGITAPAELRAHAPRRPCLPPRVVCGEAICEREGDWWVVTVPELESGGVTQARTLDEVPATVADLVALMTDTDPAGKGE